MTVECWYKGEWRAIENVLTVDMTEEGYGIIKSEKDIIKINSDDIFRIVK